MRIRPLVTALALLLLVCTLTSCDREARRKAEAGKKAVSTTSVTNVARTSESSADTHYKFTLIVYGTAGNPFFSTDTAAALRALEIGAECLLVGKKKYDGVYDADPETDPHATLIPRLTHREALERGLKVMDSTALALCMDNRLPILVFNMSTPSNISRVVRGEHVGTVVECADESGGR